MRRRAFFIFIYASIALACRAGPDPGGFSVIILVVIYVENDVDRCSVFPRCEMSRERGRCPGDPRRPSACL